MSCAGLIHAIYSKNLTSSTKLVWLCLEDLCNGQRWKEITYQEIADRMEFSLPTVERAVKELASLGILSVAHRRRLPSRFTMLQIYDRPPHTYREHQTPEPTRATPVGTQPAVDEKIYSFDPEPAAQPQLTPKACPPSLPPKIIPPKIAPPTEPAAPQNVAANPEVGPKKTAPPLLPIESKTPEVSKKVRISAASAAESSATNSPQNVSLFPVAEVQRKVDGDIDAVLRRWDEQAVPLGLPRVRVFGPKRRKSLGKMIQDMGGPGMLFDAIDRLRTARFALGESGPRGWKFSFDSLCSERLVTSLFEGKYDTPWDDPTVSAKTKGVLAAYQLAHEMEDRLQASLRQPRSATA